MIEKNLYNDYVIKLILSVNEFKITQVNDLQSLKTIVLDQKELPKIEGFIENHDWESIANLDSPKATGFTEYLDIIRFKDQKLRTFVTTIYDSDELFQDLQIINIFLIED